MANSDMTSKAKGYAAEEYATEVLLKSGYGIIARNFCVRGGELDIVAKKDDILAIVEVKARKENSILLPAEAVTHMKRRRVIYAAKCFISENPLYSDNFIRFDVFEVILKNGTTAEILGYNIIENAFTI